jgi:hypothetical protein
MKNISKVRQRGLEFHIEINDYFGTLATVIDLVRQDLGIRRYAERNEEVLIRMRDDLMYLQAHYGIEKKKRSRRRSV